MTNRIETTAKITASFGAALAALGAGVPGAEAGVVNITFSPSSSAAYFFPADIQIVGGGTIGSVFVENNRPGTYGTYVVVRGNSTLTTAFPSLVDAVQFINAGTAISSGTVSPGSVANKGFVTGASFAGTAHFEFQNGGNVGWFSVRFNGFGRAFVFVEGAYNDMGQPIVRGESASASDVPLPATLPLAGLGVLALGAAGLRRKRARAA